jgi:hypothetical protein
MKVESKNFKGIEYIQVDELPQTQREKLLQTTGRDAFIKIMINGKIVSQCMQYRDYSSWFDSVYKIKPVQVKETRVSEAMELTSSFALK